MLVRGITFGSSPRDRASSSPLLHALAAPHLTIVMTFLPSVRGYRQVLLTQLPPLIFGGA